MGRRAGGWRNDVVGLPSPPQFLVYERNPTATLCPSYLIGRLLTSHATTLTVGNVLLPIQRYMGSTHLTREDEDAQHFASTSYLGTHAKRQRHVHPRNTG